MSVTTWLDIGDLWNTGAPARTWEVDLLSAEANELIILTDSSLGGFVAEDVVEELIGFVDESEPFVNNWDTCDAPLTPNWVPDDPIDGTPGDC